jgi:hypothetical protein
MRRPRVAGLIAAALLSSDCGGKLHGNPSRLAVGDVSVERASFRLAGADGRVLRSADLVGAILGVRMNGSEVRIRIEGIARDPSDPTGRLLLHTFSIQRPGGAWQPLCDIAPDGTRSGFPLAGRSAPDGTLLPARAGDIEIICTSGAQGKCVRFGYQPWKPSGLPLFNACVRMMRADYAGRGQPGTRDGTLIQVFDRAGIRPMRGSDLSAFEAGWDEHGAVCVRHPRIASIATLHQIEASSPRLAGRIGAMCTPEEARSLGALIFNSSRV